jgi:AcrR family transcriptional regulator
MRTASGRRRRVGRPPGPRADSTQRRAELLDAAQRAIRRLGPNASMDDIAREAGMTKPILYAHFGDKAGLAAALSDRFASELVPHVLAAFQQDLEATQMVRTAIDTFIGFVEADPAVYRFLVRGFAGSESSFVDTELVKAFGLQLAQVLRTGLRNAGEDSGPAELWAFALLGAVFSAAEWWLTRPIMSRADLVDYLSTLVWRGASQAAIGQVTAGRSNKVYDR